MVLKQTVVYKMELEPTISKRRKIDCRFNVTVKVILPDEIDVPLEKVYVSKIANKQEISTIMQELSRLLPLLTCQHLKRVRQNEIILCRIDDLEEHIPLEEFLKLAMISPGVATMLCEHVQKVQVPATAPILRWQYEAMQRYWPCKFHPNKYLESLYAGTNFNDSHKQFHCNIVNLLMDLSLKFETGKQFGICVDPRTNSIVALGGSQVELNPLMHCPMVLIDFVARSQNAGAWNAHWQEEFVDDTGANRNETLAGVPKRYFDFVQQESNWKDCKFGAELLRAKGVPPEGTGDNLEKYGPYLCTGYDVYLSAEPCLMCAMALVHSRVRRIFFVQHSRGNGALISRFKLHAVKELNHHYEVFQCQTLEQKTEDTA